MKAPRARFNQIEIPKVGQCPVCFINVGLTTGDKVSSHKVPSEQNSSIFVPCGGFERIVTPYSEAELKRRGLL